MLVRIANREDPYQNSSSEADLGLCCLSLVEAFSTGN